MIKVKVWIKRLLLAVIPNLGRSGNTRNSNPRIVVLANWENLGDFVLFSSVIRETKKNFPNSKLFVVAQKENAGLVEFCPYVDRWIWVKGHHAPKSGEGHGRATSYGRKMLHTYVALLRHGKGEIDLLIGPDWLLVDDPTHLTGNFIFKIVNEGRNSLTEIAIRNREIYLDHSHQVERMLSILRMFGFKVSSDIIENWTISSNSIRRTSQDSSRKKKRALISLGAGQARRNWPVENITVLVKLISEEFPELDLKILGPPSFISPGLDELFPSSKNLMNLIGKTNLSEITELMLDADLLISNDSGLVHIAATLKLPCVVISAHPLNGNPWHLHSPNRYHPWQTRYIELQPKFLLSPCVGSCKADSPHCITAIEPNEVFEACRTLLIQS